MGVGSYAVGDSREGYPRNEDDIVGETLEVEGAHLYFHARGRRHPIRVMATTRTIRVGCVSLTREAWELLKRKVDGVPA